MGGEGGIWLLSMLYPVPWIQGPNMFGPLQLTLHFFIPRLTDLPRAQASRAMGWKAKATSNS